MELVEFKKFKSVADALKVSTSVEEGKISKSLKKLLKSAVSEAEELHVGDTKLGSLIKVVVCFGEYWRICFLKDNLDIPCLHGKTTDELMRSIRANADNLLAEHSSEINTMRLALAHSLGRYRVKFNPEKIDTMIVQAVSLLDDLDKELNKYAF